MTPLISNPLYNDNIKIFQEEGTIKSTKIIANEIFEKDGWIGYYQDNSLSSTEQIRTELPATYTGPVVLGSPINSTLCSLVNLQFPVNTNMELFYAGQIIEIEFFNRTEGTTNTISVTVGETRDANSGKLVVNDADQILCDALNVEDAVTIIITSDVENDSFNDNKSSMCEFYPFDPGYDRLSFLDDDDKPNYLMKITYPFATHNKLSLIQNGLSLGEGIPIIEKIPIHMNGRDYTAFRTPINHGLSEGDLVLIKDIKTLPNITITTGPLGIGGVVLDFNGIEVGEIPNTPGSSLTTNGQAAIAHVNNAGGTVYQSYYFISGIGNVGNFSTNIYRVAKLGDQTNSYKSRIFVIDYDPTLVSLSVGTTTLKRMVNNKPSAYYVREFSALTQTYIDYDLYPAAYGTNYFNDRQVAFNFKVDVDIEGIKDNLGRPLSEVFLTIVKNNEDGDPSNINTQYWVDKQSEGGITTNFWTPIKGGYDIGRPGDNTLNYNIRSINDTEYSSVHFQGIDESDSTFMGDIVEYNEYELLERILETPYHWINTEFRENYSKFGPTIQIGDDLITGESTPPKDKKEGYIYKPHNRIVIREYSSYVETGITGYTLNIPDYATDAFSGSSKTKRWRDQLSIGFDDVVGQGVDYPFESGAHYLFLNARFYLKRQDPACSYNFIETNLQLPPNKTEFFSIISQPSFLDYSLLNADLFTDLDDGTILDLGDIALGDESKYAYLRPPKHKCAPLNFKTAVNAPAGSKTLTKPSGIQETRWCTAITGWVKNQGGLNADYVDESGFECDADKAWDDVSIKKNKVFSACDSTSGIDHTNFCLEAAGRGHIILKKEKDKKGVCLRYLEVDVRSVEFSGEYTLGQVDTPGSCLSYEALKLKDINDVC